MIYFFYILAIILFVDFTWGASLQRSFNISTQRPEKNETSTIDNRQQQNSTLAASRIKPEMMPLKQQRQFENIFTYPPVEMNNVNQTLKELNRLKYQYMVRNHIDEIETEFALEFVPDWEEIPRSLTPARRCIEIRRQKWQYIVNYAQGKANKMANLTTNLIEFGITEYQFCTDIAYAYFMLSHNLYVAEFGANSSATILRPKFFQQVRDPLMEKSIQILLQMVPISHTDFNENAEEFILMPKELYIDLKRNTDHITKLELNYHLEERRMREASYDAFVQERDLSHRLFKSGYMRLFGRSNEEEEDSESD